MPPPLIFAVLYVQIVEKEGGWLCLKAVFESFSGIFMSLPFFFNVPSFNQHHALMRLRFLYVFLFVIYAGL